MRTARLCSSGRGSPNAIANWVSRMGTVIVQFPYRKALVKLVLSASGR